MGSLARLGVFNYVPLLLSFSFSFFVVVLTRFDFPYALFLPFYVPFVKANVATAF